MSRWNEGTLVAFDTETTGIDTSRDRIVTAVVIECGRSWGPISSEWLINPGVDIPEAATAVHGVTNHHARTHGQDATEALGEIRSRLVHAWDDGHPVIGHNIVYDLTLLAAELDRHGLPGFAPARVIDTYVLDKHVDPYRKGKRNLETTAAHYGFDMGDGAHGAHTDAITAARIAWRIANQYPEVGDATLDDLTQTQTGWSLKQTTSLQDYFNYQGTGEIVEHGWPLRPIKTEADA
jgi:DNA polymerase-3 subunit epsilon